MSEQKHTPTPTEASIAAMQRQEIARLKERVAYWQEAERTTSSDLQKLNADFLRLRNSHAALLAACRAAKAHLCFGHRDDWLKVLDQLTAAIAEAE